LEQHRQEIDQDELVVVFADECHLLWGDVCGYAWGKRRERLEAEIGNQRSRQTYYGALNLKTGQCLVQAAASGNEEQTVAFLQYLLNHYCQRRIALLWDGATYHKSQYVRDYLESVNQGLAPSQWQITCLQFAPNDPKQNPIEDVWLQAKRLLRECYYCLKSFSTVKYLFEFATHLQTFNFPKLFKYGNFSQII
jgi:transposase